MPARWIDLAKSSCEDLESVMLFDVILGVCKIESPEQLKLIRQLGKAMKEQKLRFTKDD